MPFDVKFFTSVVPDAIFLYKVLPDSISFSIDSRSLEEGQMFIALDGASHDGHRYVSEAIARGCSGFIISHEKKQLLDQLEEEVLQNLCVVLVPHPLQALLSLAEAWRTRCTMPIVAITGSVGKTSTKNILAEIFKEAGKNFLISYGNQNTAIGVALNLLQLTERHDGAIFEVGISKRGEMARIVSMLRPTSALITYIGHSHMEGLGSLGDIAAEKCEIFSFLKEDNVGIINGDMPVLANIAYPHPVIKFGLKKTNQIQARKVVCKGSHTHFILKIYSKKYPIVLPTNHSGMLLNSLAAVSAAYYMGISDEVIIRSLQKPIVISGRFEKRDFKNHKGYLINDCYNANPESMKAALLAFEAIDTSSQKIAVLGDMLELGVDSAFWHRQLGRFLVKISAFEKIILVGSMMAWTRKMIPGHMSVIETASWEEALSKVEEVLVKESIVLVKGSRAIGLSNLVDSLAEIQDR
jgi:UDP-N-acetylmuramoyl-tripeptide--D-alanyl-D-alanine ligase